METWTETPEVHLCLSQIGSSIPYPKESESSEKSERMLPAMAAGIYPENGRLKGFSTLHLCVVSNNFQTVKFVISWQNYICLYSTGDGGLLYSQLALESKWVDS